MQYLWERPDIVSKIIINSNINDVKDFLAPFFCNNFFQNLLSPYTVEENLLYVISMLLKDEVDKLNSENDLDLFLNNSRCGYLLNELRQKSDVITYAKTVIFGLIEKLENNSYIALNLDIYYLENVIEKLVAEKSLTRDKYLLEDFLFSNNLSGEQKTKELKVNKNNEYLKIFEIDNMEEVMIFNTKYLPNLDINEFEEIINNTKDKDMLEFLNKYKEILLNDKDIFSNDQIVDIICKMNHSDLLITLYQVNFLKIIEFMDLLIESLISNIKIIPKSIKYISKLIYNLIKKKFPEIKTMTLNSFIGRFFFINLMIPLFKSPFNLFINDFVISHQTLENLTIFFEIFSKFVLGNLYTYEKFIVHYKPFNRYFIEKMPKLFEFYKDLIQIKFPDFIEKILQENYDYSKINDNNNQILIHRAFCFSLNEMFVLINNINDNQDLIFSEKDKNENNKLYKTFKKLNENYYKNVLNNIITKDKNNDDKKEQLVLLTDLVINPEYEYLFKIEEIKPYFYIKELKNISSKEDSIKNNIIKSKNYISGLLYNCRDLESSEFSSQKTLDILKEIKLFLKTSEFVLDNSLPYEWYVNSLLECLVFLPQDLSDNDYYLFYEEIKKDINHSIQLFDFYKITDCFGKIKYIQNAIEFLNKGKNSINDISLNEKVKNLVENNYFEVEFRYSSNTFKILKIKSNQIPEKNYTYKKAIHLILL